MRRFLISFAFLSLLGLAGPRVLWAQECMRVVSTFSILGDLVRNVGGEAVCVLDLVGANEDAHVYEPPPGDVRRIAAADVVVINGLGFEGWIERLLRAAEYSGVVVEATRGVEPLRVGTHGGGHDPHAWTSVVETMTYVANIRDGLASATPEHADAFGRNAEHYLERLRELDAWVRTALGDIEPGRRTILTSHDAFAYFGREYGVTFLAPQGVGTENEPSAREVASLIEAIRAGGVRAVFLENITDPRLIEQIAREAGARVGGVLYSDALSSLDGPASTYVELVRHNVLEIAQALRGEETPR